MAAKRGYTGFKKVICDVLEVVTSLTAPFTITALSAVTGVFSGAISAVGATFTAALNGTTAAFSGALSAASAAFTGAVSAASVAPAGAAVPGATSGAQSPGTTRAIGRVFRGFKSIAGTAISGQGHTSTTITIPGVRIGDFVVVEPTTLPSASAPDKGLVWLGRVSADDTVTVVLWNSTGNQSIGASFFLINVVVFQLTPVTVAITPNDSADLAAPVYGITASGAGNITCNDGNGASDVIAISTPGLVQQGLVITRVLATGTTATGITGYL